VATVLVIFPKINWPNWQILCSLFVCLCFVWRIGGPGPPEPTLLATPLVLDLWLLSVNVFFLSLLHFGVFFELYGAFCYKRVRLSRTCSINCILSLLTYFSHCMSVIHSLFQWLARGLWERLMLMKMQKYSWWCPSFALTLVLSKTEVLERQRLLNTKKIRSWLWFSWTELRS